MEARLLTFLALLGMIALGSTAKSQEIFDNNSLNDERRYDVPLPLPESLNGAVRPGQQDPIKEIDRIRDVFRAVQACWTPPKGGGYSGQEITLRLSFKRSGEVIGEPRITFYKAGTQEERREDFSKSVREALARCTPLPFTARFGAAVAGRIFTIRFMDSRPL